MLHSHIQLKKQRMRFSPKHLIGILFLLITSIAFTQNSKTGSWDIIALNAKLKKEWTLYLETQTRSQSIASNFYYHELKGGLQYNLPNNNSLFVGTGNYVTYPFPGNYKSPATTKEFRLWEQFVFNNYIGRVQLEHRYRIEQRWVNGVYSNRFRYRINPTIPINHSSLVPKTVYATTFEEVFFTDNAPYFLRNRFFIGTGYKFTNTFTLQGGFIRQFDYNTSTGGSGKNFAQILCSFTLDKTAHKAHSLQSTID